MNTYYQNMQLNTPFFCNYWTTYRCNSRCEFCNIWRDESLHTVPDARFEDTKQNLDDLKAIGVKMIDFTGGEPLLNNDLPQILAYAKQLGFFVKLSTNGYLYPQNAKKLQGLASRIYFSLDTTSRDHYKKIRGIDGYDRVVESITLAKSLGEHVCILYTVTNETVHKIGDIVAFCNTHKVPVYIHPCFSYFGNTQLHKQYISQIKRYFWHPYVRMSPPDLTFHEQGGNDQTHPSCKVGHSTIDISPDNCLTIPCFHHTVKKIPINGQLRSLYESEQWERWFQDAGSYDFCNHCTIDCYFGLSYLDKIEKYFIKQNLTILKNIIENRRG